MNRITRYQLDKSYSHKLSIRQTIEKELAPIIQARRNAELSLSNRFARTRPAGGYRKQASLEAYSTGTIESGSNAMLDNCPIMAAGEAMKQRDAQS